MRPVPPTLPLARWPIFHATDPERARQHVTDLYTGHRLRFLQRDGHLDARLNSKRLHDCALAAVTYGGEVTVESEEPRPFFAVVVPLGGGDAVLRLGQDEVRPNGRTAAVMCTSERFAMRWSPDSAQLVLRIERTALERHLADLLGERLRQRLRFAPELDTTSGAGHLIRTELTRLVAQLDRNGSLIDRPLVWQDYEQALMTTMLLGHAHNYSDALHTAPAPPPASARDLDTALVLLEAHPEQPWNLGLLAGRVGVSVRSLKRAFHARDITFRKRLTEIRLRRVYDDLLAYPPDLVTVGVVAARWGFIADGRFRAAYRHQFGETPTETLHH